MTETQVWSGLAVLAGQSRILHWNWTGGPNNSDVPLKTVLDISTLTFIYIIPPSGAANVARVVVDGRDQKGTSVWRVDVYVEKEKTLHLPFPLALRLEAGGYVEVGFTTDKDIVFISANGRLVDI